MKLSTNWRTKNDTAKEAVEKLKPLLDQRIKAIKDATPEQIEQTLCSFLAYGNNEFQVHVEGNPLLAAIKDCLVGQVLQRTSGKNGFKIKEGYNKGCEFESLIPVERAPRIDTFYGSVITDGNYHDIPLDQIFKVNYHPLQSITVVKPQLQTKWMIEGSAPKINWTEIEDDELTTPIMSVEYDKDLPEEMRPYINYERLFAKIRDNAVAGNISLVPYKDDTIFCQSIAVACINLWAESQKLKGGAFNGFRYMVNCQSILVGSNGVPHTIKEVSHGFKDLRY